MINLKEKHLIKNTILFPIISKIIQVDKRMYFGLIESTLKLLRFL